MKKILAIVLLIWIVSMNCFATEMTDAELEQGAQETLPALLQYTNAI